MLNNYILVLFITLSWTPFTVLHSSFREEEKQNNKSVFPSVKEKKENAFSKNLNSKKLFSKKSKVIEEFIPTEIPGTLYCNFNVQFDSLNNDALSKDMKTNLREAKKLIAQICTANDHRRQDLGSLFILGADEKLYRLFRPYNALNEISADNLQKYIYKLLATEILKAQDNKNPLDYKCNKILNTRYVELSKIVKKSIKDNKLINTSSVKRALSRVILQQMKADFQTVKDFAQTDISTIEQKYPTLTPIIKDQITKVNKSYELEIAHFIHQKLVSKLNQAAVVVKDYTKESQKLVNKQYASYKTSIYNFLEDSKVTYQTMLYDQVRLAFSPREKNLKLLETFLKNENITFSNDLNFRPVLINTQDPQNMYFHFLTSDEEQTSSKEKKGQNKTPKKKSKKESIAPSSKPIYKIDQVFSKTSEIPSYQEKSLETL